MSNAAPSIADGARGLWRSEAGRKWLVPLVVFLTSPQFVEKLGRESHDDM